MQPGPMGMMAKGCVCRAGMRGSGCLWGKDAGTSLPPLLAPLAVAASSPLCASCPRACSGTQPGYLFSCGLLLFLPLCHGGFPRTPPAKMANLLQGPD